MRLTLELRPTGGLLVHLGSIRLDTLLQKTVAQIQELQVCLGNRVETLGTLFDIKTFTAEKDEIVLTGETCRLLYAGRGMTSAKLVIDSDAGPFTGAELSGGEIEVLGNAGDGLGAALSAGLLHVHGSAGDCCGAALPGKPVGMTGGTILVDGSVQRNAGACMRRGLLVIGGDAGSSAGSRMLAGTLLCLGNLGAAAGVGMQRGSIVAARSRALLPGFRSAGQADIEWLRIYLAYLQGLHFPFPRQLLAAAWSRFTGDHLVTGKGELFIHEIIE